MSYCSLKRGRRDSPRCICRPRLLQFHLYSPCLSFTANQPEPPDISAPSDRLDECELIGLMIFPPHFPPLYGCSMVHGADGWIQLPHTHTLARARTHTSYLTSTVPTSPAHNALRGRRTQTFVYSLASPDALAHESPFRRSSRARCERRRVPLWPGRLRMSRAPLVFFFWLSLSFQTARTGASH